MQSRKGDLAKTVDTQASHLSVSASQPKATFQKVFSTITFSFILQFPYNFPLNFLRLSRRCFQPQANPSTSSQVRARSGPAEKNCIANHRADASLLFWPRTALRKIYSESELVQ